MFLPIPAWNQAGLIADLEDDPFVEQQLPANSIIVMACS